ncbi:hypothetical protein [Variovorax sp. YR266]|uniref:hypothetical protein n=1 Tax=Variovorax sp. YR266 TaxID=1884386 RepID=UPI0011600880|nr:hypothetical protein [Variovorax sp. YR266]
MAHLFQLQAIRQKMPQISRKISEVSIGRSSPVASTFPRNWNCARLIAIGLLSTWVAACSGGSSGTSTEALIAGTPATAPAPAPAPALEPAPAQGTSWKSVKFGGIGVMAADQNIYGRIYVSGTGRGALYSN